MQVQAINKLDIEAFREKGRALGRILEIKERTIPFKPEYHDIILGVIAGEKWDATEYKSLPLAQQDQWIDIITVALNCLTSYDLDLFINRIDSILYQDVRKSIFERNHDSITRALAVLTQKQSRFPSRTQIAAETGLSRVTVNKHLKGYFSSESYAIKKDEFLLMREQILAIAFNMANRGDMRAARVFLEATDHMEKPFASIRNQQNNFIQINGSTISEEQIKRLPVEKQYQLMELLTSVTQLSTTPQQNKN